MSSVDVEKTLVPNEAEVKPTASTNTTPVDKDEVVSADTDDALKLAGTQVHQFDDKYYARLRRKIVSYLISSY